MNKLATLPAKALELVRFKEWYSSKLVICLLVLYYALRAKGTPPTDGLLLFLVATGFLVLFLSFGYLVNDVYDREADHEAGKRKLLWGLKARDTALFAFALLLGGLVLVLLANHSWQVVAASFASYLMGFLYSAPPFRFKEKPLSGLLVASIAQRTLPALVILSLADYFSYQALLLIAMLTVVGLREILVHQLRDFDADRRSGLQTFVTRYGAERTERMLLEQLVPLELLVLGGVVAMLGVGTPPVIPFTAVSLAGFTWVYYPRLRAGDIRTPLLIRGDFLAHFYGIFLPLLFCLALAMVSPYYLLLMVFQLLIGLEHLMALARTASDRVREKSTKKDFTFPGMSLEPLGNLHLWNPISSKHYVEWWYFDAIFECGSVLSGSFMITGHLNNPVTVCAVADFQLSIDGESINLFTQEGIEAFMVSDEPSAVAIGNSHFTFENGACRLFLDDGDTVLDLSFVPECVGFCLCEDGLLSRDGLGRVFCWEVPLPRAKATGTFSSAGRTRRLEGIGYHDHNWSDMPIEESVAFWHWGRLHDAERTLVLAGMQFRNVGGFGLLVVIENGLLSASFHSDACMISQDLNAASVHAAESIGSHDWSISMGDSDLEVFLTGRLEKVIQNRSRLRRAGLWAYALGRVFLHNPRYMRSLSCVSGSTVKGGVEKGLDGVFLHELSIF